METQDTSHFVFMASLYLAGESLSKVWNQTFGFQLDTPSMLLPAKVASRLWAMSWEKTAG
ncbi:hypothetical protein E5D57_008606 [Metarhizium anisopliae]|nr:hypothetical protein E5D57_008606 [Metarhizium anisopliae]